MFYAILVCLLQWLFGTWLMHACAAGDYGPAMAVVLVGFAVASVLVCLAAVVVLALLGCMLFRLLS